MKKFIFGFFSLVFSSIFAVNLVNWDIIDPSWNYREPDNILSYMKTFNHDSFEKRPFIENNGCSYCTKKVSYNIWNDIIITEFLAIMFFILILLLLTLSAWFLYKVFEKLWEKWWKSLIPIKNLYCLADLTRTKKINFIWWFLAIWWGILIMFLVWIYWSNNPFKFSWSDIILVFAYLPMIIVFFIYDYFTVISFYRLFRKFGWNKWCSVLWTIFLPIWACILWFWNFKPQWEKLGNKKENK